MSHYQDDPEDPMQATPPDPTRLARMNEASARGALPGPPPANVPRAAGGPRVSRASMRGEGGAAARAAGRAPAPAAAPASRSAPARRPKATCAARRFPSNGSGASSKMLRPAPSIAPPLLSGGVRDNIPRKFLQAGPGDVVLDLGCGSGRFAMWNLDSGAHFIGVDTGTFFAAESRASSSSPMRRIATRPLDSHSASRSTR